MTDPGVGQGLPCTGPICLSSWFSPALWPLPLRKTRDTTWEGPAFPGSLLDKLPGLERMVAPQSKLYRVEPGQRWAPSGALCPAHF